MKRLFIPLLFAVISLLCGACRKSTITMYDGSYFIWFDAANSGPVSINEEATLSAEYSVHLSATMPKSAVKVKFEVVPGDGLKENTDYQILTTGGTLTFYPGLFSLPIRIKWLPNKVDPAKDNSVTIRLTGCAPDGYSLGMPGPDHNLEKIIITKYKN